MPSDKELDYEIGYGRPPRHTRFAPRRSGNPRGRPSRSKNLSILLSEALNEPVIVVENSGRPSGTARVARRSPGQGSSGRGRRYANEFRFAGNDCGPEHLGD
jgi:hypothetical protein